MICDKLLRKVDVHTQTDRANVKDNSITNNEGKNKINISQLLNENKTFKAKVSSLEKQVKHQKDIIQIYYDA